MAKATIRKNNPDEMTRIQSIRRRELIDAAMEVIAEKGLTGLTLAKVASRVGLTAAMINFHFDSKDALLRETLNEVVREFEERMSDALEGLEDEPATALRKIIDVHFDPDLTNQTRTGVWYAFMGDANARTSYIDYLFDDGFSTSDRRYLDVIMSYVNKLLEKDRRSTDAEAITLGLIGILECMWQDRLMTPDAFDNASSRKLCDRYLASVLPEHFT